MPDEPVEKPKRTRKRAPAPVDPQARLAELKEKYRLAETVKINALGHSGKPLGRGPLLDDQVLSKLAELDTTPEKRYLDWMLFQCGGGPQAVTASLTTWGEGTKPLDPNEILQRWQRAARGESRISAEDITYVGNLMEITPQLQAVAAKLIRAASEANEDPARLPLLANVLKGGGIAPGKEDKVAVALLSYRVKKFVRNQSDIKARDRIHTTLTYAQLLAGKDLTQFEQEWESGLMMRKKREYVLGDEDSLKWGFFCFSRNWPGKDGRYEKVYNEMKQFLMNKARVENRTAKLDQWNAQIKAKNVELNLPDDQAIPLREPIDVPLDIGVVTMTKHLHLEYEGSFPKLSDLAKVNAQIEALPMRERIRGDVRYAGPKGKIGRTEKLYSDANLDVLVPLTVMASIKGGHSSWDISKPDQLDDLESRSWGGSSAWARTHSSTRGESGGAVSLFFILKAPDVPEEYQKLRLTININDLVNIEPNELGAFAVSMKLTPGKEGANEVDFKSLIQGLKGAMSPETYSGMVRSISRALRALREWSKEFDPKAMVPDFVNYHAERAKNRRGLRETIQFRAAQVVDQLVNT